MMIYAIHKRTKEHRVVKSNGIICEKEWYTSHGWRLVGADADGWIPWEGGECCPLPEGADYEVRHKDGEEMPKREAETYKAQWLGKGLLSDIIAYRPILDADSEPEEPEWDGIAISVRHGRIVGVTIPKGFQNGIIRISGAEIEIQEE